MLAVQLVGLSILIAVSVWVSQDARKRGMSIKWGIGVGLLSIVFLPLYFIVRKPIPKCPSCENDIPVSRSLCEECEAALLRDPADGRSGRIFG